MRILYAGHSLAEPLGGGELSGRTLLTALANGHDVEAVGVGSKAGHHVLENGVRCVDHAAGDAPLGLPLPFHLAAIGVESRLRARLVQHFADHRPELLLLQQPAFLRPEDLPDDIPIVVFIRSLLCYGVGDPTPSRWRRAAGAMFQAVHLRRTRPFLERADLVVCNSRFMQHALRERTGIASEVVHPFIDSKGLTAPTSADEREFVTFVGIDPWKGLSIALRLAELFPDRPFLFLIGRRGSQRHGPRIRRCANITCLPWTDDMGALLRRTRVLLMPSLWEEPFGRLPVEAGACGVPTIASARGGLAESVGEGGVLIEDALDLSRWTRALRDLDDPDRYQRLSAAAERNAEGLHLEVTLSQFRELVRRKLSLEL